ncbi:MULTISPECIES: hypothetical protein [Citrobacter freundii complex]
MNLIIILNGRSLKHSKGYVSGALK